MKKILFVVGLSTVLFVGCGQKQKESKQSVAPVSSISTTSGQSTSSTLAPVTASSSETVKGNFDLDLDPEAIRNGDFTTLVGTWKNGRGETMEIENDGTVNGTGIITPKDAFDSESTISSVPVQPKDSPTGGYVLFLFKIGDVNPNGDSSDQSKARLIGTQDSLISSAEDYYYRASQGIDEKPVRIISQEQAQELIVATQDLDDDIAIAFYEMIGNDYLFTAYSKSTLANGGSGTQGYFRVSPQGEVRITDKQGN
jgi:hypothetical protein